MMRRTTLLKIGWPAWAPAAARPAARGLAALALSTALAAAAPATTPAAASASPPGSAPAAPEVAATEVRAASVDAVFAAFDRTTSPGCALGVIRDGRLIYARGYGMANLEHGVPITTTTVFDIGSTSKQFAAASIVLLSLDGRLSIDDDIRKHLPEIPAYRRPITIRHMLNHTSGLRDYLELMALTGVHFDGVATAEDALAIIARQKDTNFLPGDEYLYSNSGFFLLSEIVKRVSGKTLRGFARERIFDPLDMRQTHFHDDHTLIVPRRATGYAPLDAGGFRIDMSGFEQTGDGSVLTTVEDLARWDRNFYDPNVGGRAMLEALHTRGVLTSGQPLDYALGLVVDEYRGLKRVSHGGSWAGYRAQLMRFPDERFSVVCLCNLATSNPSALARKVAELYLAARLAAAPESGESAAAGGAPAAGGEAATGPPAAAVVALSTARLEALAGVYRNPRTEEILKIFVESGRLKGRAHGETFDLAPIAPDRFRVQDDEQEITFETPAGPGPRRARVSPGRGPVKVLEAITPVRPGPAQLAAYAGSYHSDELQARFELVVEKDGLHLRGKNLPKEALEPTVPDVFVADELTLKFERGKGRRVTGFSLGAGRIRSIRFVRQAAGAP
jgi:CubicO group peptidase (beta-lactamase class C family)